MGNLYGLDYAIVGLGAIGILYLFFYKGGYDKVKDTLYGSNYTRRYYKSGYTYTR